MNVTGQTYLEYNNGCRVRPEWGRKEGGVEREEGRGGGRGRKDGGTKKMGKGWRERREMEKRVEEEEGSGGGR